MPWQRLEGFNSPPTAEKEFISLFLLFKNPTFQCPFSPRSEFTQKMLVLFPKFKTFYGDNAQSGDVSVQHPRMGKVVGKNQDPLDRVGPELGIHNVE